MRLNTIKYPSMPLTGDRMLTEDGYIVSGIPAGSQVVIADERTGRGVSPPVASGWMPDTAKKPRRMPLVVRPVQLDIEITVSVDNAGQVFIGTENEIDFVVKAAMTSSGYRMNPKTIEVLKAARDKYIYIFANNYGDDNGVIVNVKNVKTGFLGFTDTVRWQAVKTNAVINLEYTVSPDTLLPLIQAGGWDTPTGALITDTSLNGYWTSWMPPGTFIAESFWIWGPDGLLPPGSPYRIVNIVRAKISNLMKNA